MLPPPTASANQQRKQYEVVIAVHWGAMLDGGKRLARKMPDQFGMNVRITSTTDGRKTILFIAGRLQSVDLAELNKEITSDVGSLVLDLSELQSADETGIMRLGELSAGGAEFRGVSRYMQMLLNDQ